MKLLLSVIFCTLFSWFLVSPVSAQTPTPQPGTISLSEVFACQGAGEKEWIEIKNSGTTEAVLTDWKLKDDTQTNKHQFSITIPAGGYGVVEIAESNAIYNNSSKDTVKLVDQSDNNIDVFEYSNCDTAWVWAKSGTEWKQTTAKTSGKANEITAPPSSTPTQNTTATPTPTATATTASQPSNISISEIYACQVDGGKEWVELYNDNNSSVTLTDWKLLDDDNNDQPISSLTISAKGYGVVEVSKYSRGMLTNDGDVISLVDGAGKTVENKEYSSCSTTTSYAKVSGDWKQTTSITKGSANAFTAVTSNSTPTATPTASPTPKTTASPTPTSSASPSASSSALPTSTPEGEVLGISDEVEVTPEPEVIKEQQSSGSGATGAIVAMGLGGILLCGVGGYLGYEWYSKKYGKLPFQFPFAR